MENVSSEHTKLLALPSELSYRGRHYLLVFERDLSTRVIPLPADGTLDIGRGKDTQVQLHDRAVSRRHVRITQVEGRAHIADLDSQNGTLVNRERLATSRQLVSGDTIVIGTVTIVYHASAVRADTTPPRDVVPEDHAPPAFRPLADEIRELEKQRISDALTAAAGNQRVAARLLGMPLRTFVFKLRQYGLRRIDER